MSSGKLDQSLDEIMKDRKTTGGPRRTKGRVAVRKGAPKTKAATTAAAAPTGGIQKNTKAAKATKVKTTLTAATRSGDSKITVSNLPEDVNERLIKDYFTTMVAPVKHVILNYGPTGRSRGSAVVIFNDPAAAAKAAEFDRVKVDGKPMRIEVVLGAKSIPQAPTPKPLSERVSKPKNAAQDKTKGVAAKAKDAAKTATAAGKAGRNKKSGRAGRPQAKTAEELDAEMADYWDGGETNGTAKPAVVANGADTGMVDEVM